MKTNLLLLDSYKNIENLISFAFSFSNRIKSKLKIIYVFDFDWMKRSYLATLSGTAQANLYVVENDARKEFEVAETKIKDLVTEYKKHNKVQVPLEFHTTETNRIDLVREEFEENPDMLLMISNHQSYIEASQGVINYPNIIDSVKCPVLVIPEDIKHAIFKNILYATDYNPEDVTSLKHLRNFLGQRENSTITVFHNEYSYDFDEKLKWSGFQDVVKEAVGSEHIEFRLKTDKDFLKGVEDFVEKEDPDMLVLLKEKKGFFEHVFSTNDTKNVLTHFHKPVMVYHES